MANRDVVSWSTTAANNATADSAINWSEGQAPSSVNDSARAEMAAVARYRDDISGAKITLAGGTTAYTATTNQTIDTLADGIQIAFICNATNTGASTLNVNGIGAKDLQLVDGADIPAGTLVANSIYTATYDSGKDAWLLHGCYGHQTTPPGAIMAYGGSSAPTGWLLCNGDAVSRTTYAALFAAIGTAFGVGDGSSTFNVPNLVGRVPAGVDSGSARLDSFTSLGSTIGAKSVTLTATELPAHTHSLSVSGTTSSNGAHTHTGTTGNDSPDHTHAFTADVGGAGAAATAGAGVTVSTASVSATGGASTNHTHTFTTDSNGAHTHTVTSTGTSGSAGTGSAFGIVQPSLAVNYIIKL